MPSASWPTTATRSSCSRPAAVRGLRRHRGVGLLGDPGGEVDVVGREVLDHADVGDPRRERALAARDDLVDVAEVAVRRVGARSLLQRRVVALDVTDGADQAARPRTPRRAGRRPRRRGERLLDHRVHPRRGERETDRLVEGGGGGDHAVVDAGRDELVDVCRRPDGQPATPCGSPAGSATATSSTPVERAQDAGVVAAHHAQAEQPRAQASSGARRRDRVDGARRCARGRPATATGAPAATAPRARRARSRAGPARARSASATAAGGSGSGSRRRCRRRARRRAPRRTRRGPGRHADRVLVVDVRRRRRRPAGRRRRSRLASRNAALSWRCLRPAGELRELRHGRSPRGCRSSGR